MGNVRRWPPFIGMGTALTLMLLVFPNPLRNPQNNPTASAEYAPIPGRSQSAQNANFGETDLATSGGIGAGGAGFGVLPGRPAVASPDVFEPRHKNCIGNPPRQTDDPLSPPCVPYFLGDNGAKTWQGVTKDEIEVVLYNDFGVTADLNEPWQPSDENPDNQASLGGRDIVKTLKAQLRYFNERYQTYGRLVRVKAIASTSGTGCPARKGAALQIAYDEKPFAVTHLYDNGHCFLERSAELGIPALGLNQDVPREGYERFRNYVWGFFPDQEAEAAWAASFICRTLYSDEDGRPGKGIAHFSTDPDLNGKPRRFGLIYPQKGSGNWERGPENAALAELLKTYTQRECGMRWTADGADGSHLVERFLDSGSYGGSEAPVIMRKFKDAGVTTVICYCVAVLNELTVTKMMNAATQLNYFPEWYWDHTSRMFRAIWQQRYGDNSGRHTSLGISHHWRNPAMIEQHHYRAYQAEEPGSVPNTRFNFDIHHLFLNLFQGIQGAGPNLTPDTMKQGMFTFTYQQPANPWVPTGGYGLYGPDAVSEFTWIDTAMAWWWDPRGTPPGGREEEGCSHVMNGGRRYYAKTWPMGDADLFPRWERGSRTPVYGGAPCTQEDTKLDPATG